MGVCLWASTLRYVCVTWKSVCIPWKRSASLANWQRMSWLLVKMLLRWAQVFWTDIQEDMTRSATISFLCHPLTSAWKYSTYLLIRMFCSCTWREIKQEPYVLVCKKPLWTQMKWLKYCDKSSKPHRRYNMLWSQHRLTWLSSSVSIRFSSALSRGIPVLVWVSYDNDITLHVWVISAKT